MRKCKLSTCNRNHYSKGYCEKHYRRWKKWGNPNYLSLEQHGMWESPEYRAWSAMKQRCYNHKDKRYKDYGGREIKVCNRWKNSFIAFYKDMGKRPDGLTLDRINNDNNYEPYNCRWATSIENSRHRRDIVASVKIANKVRKLHKSGIMPKSISEQLNLSKYIIANILYYEHWSK